MGYVDDINISTDGLQVFGTTSHRKTLITAVIDAVKELGADGINLDVETIKSDVDLLTYSLSANCLQPAVRKSLFFQ